MTVRVLDPEYRDQLVGTDFPTAQERIGDLITLLDTALERTGTGSQSGGWEGPDALSFKTNVWENGFKVSFTQAIEALADTTTVLTTGTQDTIDVTDRTYTIGGGGGTGALRRPEPLGAAGAPRRSGGLRLSTGI